jgi:hypothetical protein
MIGLEEKTPRHARVAPLVLHAGHDPSPTHVDHHDCVDSGMRGSTRAGSALVVTAMLCLLLFGGADGLNKYEAPAGFYYPLNASIPGGESMQDAFRFVSD